MKITRHICDRCGKTFEERGFWGVIKKPLIMTLINYSNSDCHMYDGDICKYKYEVCPECYKEFLGWIKGDKE